MEMELIILTFIMNSVTAVISWHLGGKQEKEIRIKQLEAQLEKDRLDHQVKIATLNSRIDSLESENL